MAHRRDAVSLSRGLLRVPSMKILNSAKRSVQAATTKAASSATKAAKKTAKALTPRVDSFHDGVKVRVGKAEAHVTPNAHGVSVTHGEDTFGVSFRLRDGAASLGAVAIKIGKVEVSVGLMPAAPAPTPAPVYVGKPRDE